MGLLCWLLAGAHCQVSERARSPGSGMPAVPAAIYPAAPGPFSVAPLLRSFPLCVTDSSLDY